MSRIKLVPRPTAAIAIVRHHVAVVVAAVVVFDVRTEAFGLPNHTHVHVLKMLVSKRHPLVFDKVAPMALPHRVVLIPPSQYAISLRCLSSDVSRFAAFTS